MTASIKLQLTLPDDFTRFYLFSPAWVVVKSGQRDDDYEPGHIASNHSASVTVEFDGNGPGLFRAIEQLTEVAAKTVTDCIAMDKHTRGEVSIGYDIHPPSPTSLAIPVESLAALTSFGFPLVIRPQLDCWIETRESDGAIMAKYERII